ncbi:hypothetical protein RCL1_002603 [Eukaryota sp. TZLM3-RCL]
MSLQVNIKHGKNAFQLNLDPSVTVGALKAKIADHSSVPPNNQKLFGKSGQLKDDKLSLSDVNITSGSTLTLIGQAIDQSQLVVEKPLFIEDMALERPDVIQIPRRGLSNLQNTCYLNSVVQSLACVPHLSETTPPSDLARQLVSTLKSVQGTGQAITPMSLVNRFRTVFPQFSERTEQGFYAQQDAEECLAAFLSLFNSCPPISSPLARLSENGSEPQSLTQQLFGIEIVKEFINVEAEEKSIQPSQFLTSIKISINPDLDYLEQGIQNSLSDSLTKHSDVLGRNAEFKVTSTISTLPPFLCINLVRFEWREDIQQRAKILKKVTFPVNLDMAPMTTPSLKTKITSNRESNSNYGTYRLAAVIAHQGRSAMGGHYLAYVKLQDTPDQWIFCDDAKTTLIKEEKVLQLAGGGDAPTCYILMYQLVV